MTGASVEPRGGGAEFDASRVGEILQRAASRVLPAGGFDRAGAQRKDDGSLVTAIDTSLQEIIAADLEAAYPGIPLLGEEMSHARQSAVLEIADGEFWVLDPLDGTTNFIAGFPFFGLSLALVRDGRAVVGAIYDPLRGELFTAEAGAGARLNGQPIAPTSVARLAHCIANVDYKRLTRTVAERLVRCPPYRSQRNLGSCVLEWCWLALGRFQLYLHGGQKLWDYAAGSLVLEEAGGALAGFDGSPLDCRSLGKRAVIAATDPRLLEQWMEWVSRESPLGGPGGFG